MARSTHRSLLAQYMLATPPALFGQGDKNQETASGQAQLAAQARGQLSLFWSAMQRQWARIRYPGGTVRGQNPDYSGRNTGSPARTRSTSRFRAIAKGHFGAFPDEESSFLLNPQIRNAQCFREIIEIALEIPANRHENPRLAEKLENDPDLQRDS